MENIIYKAKSVDNGEWVYFNNYGMYCDEKGNIIQPKIFTRDYGYKVIEETIERMTN